MSGISQSESERNRPFAVTGLPQRGGQAGGGRWVIGALLSSGYRQLRLALLSAQGNGLRAKIQATVYRSVETPETVRQGYDVMTAQHKPRLGEESSDPGLPAAFAGQLADFVAEQIQELLFEAGESVDQILAISVQQPGLWNLADSRRSYLGLLDAARLAELTGISVIDDYPSRDLARGGQGGPLSALPLWLLLHHPHRTRLLLDLGRTTRLTYIPPAMRHQTPELFSFDVGPGMGLIDHLTHELTEGKRGFDASGHLAVQGRKIPDLVTLWLEDPYFSTPPPKWHPLGCGHEKELSQTVKMAIESGWSVRDLLCTACHFIAETIRMAFDLHLPKGLKIDDVLISGGGQKNGMLLRVIANLLDGQNLVRTASVGLPDSALEPAATGVLALLHIDQIPANQTNVTGTDVPRVLGRLTPGTPVNWHRLQQQISTNLPKKMSLRSAM